MGLKGENAPNGKEIELWVNESYVATFSINNNIIELDNLNIDINKGDWMNLYVSSGGGKLEKAIAHIEVCWRA
jgi:hypothetical protein